MRYGSVCSGIEAASVAWDGFGWECSFLSEIEKFPRAVLSHHYPTVPLHGDFTTIKAGDYEPIDLLVGGTPCQSFSIAGLRGGMDDERGNLALEFLRLADRLRPRWVLWENVPGVLSSNGGRDFGSFLGGLVKLGYGFAYRVLDAQFFGLAQRRQRVFVVGYLGDWRRAAAVLFEPESLRGHPAPSRKARKDVAGTTAQSVAMRGRDGGATAELGDDVGFTLRGSQGGGDKAHVLTGDIAMCLNAHPNGSDGESETFITHALTGNGFDASEDGAGRGTPLVPVAFDTYNQTVTGDTTQTLCSRGDTPSGNAHLVPAIAFTTEQTPKFSDNSALTLTKQSPTGGGQPQCVMNQAGVRRLTPRECERLQGFPDDYTAIPYRGKIAADGPRYKALGNSMAVPVMRKIGERIAAIENAIMQAAA